MKAKNRHSLLLLIFLSCAFFAAYQLWLAWPNLVLQSVRWQGEINNQLSELLYLAKENLNQAAMALITLSFTYGLLHSLGPGHGKVIVTTYLATHPSKVKNSLAITVIASLMQALVAISLVSLLVFVFNYSMREVNAKAELVISFSFICLVVLGGYIIYRAAKQLITINKKSSAPKISFTKFSAATSKPIVGLNRKPTTENHGSNCGCGHQHFADAKTINNASTLREYAALIFSIGIRPCTGAIMVLLFANMLDMYWLGMVSAVVMAIGTAFTISVIALLTVTGKKIVHRYLSTQAKKQHLAFSGLLLQCVGGAFLLVMGLLLFSGQSSTLSPVF